MAMILQHFSTIGIFHYLAQHKLAAEAASL